jgi:dolichyl-phosphate-mannose--protein O-mannosyl transferase
MTSTRAKFNEKQSNLLNHMLRNYEENCVAEYGDEDQQNLWFLNADINGLTDCSRTLVKNVKKNPFSLIN